MEIIKIEDFSNKLRTLISSRFKKNVDFYNEFDKKYGTNIQATCKQWLAGHNFPKIDHLIYLCDYFDCDIEYLLTNQKEHKKTDSETSEILGLSIESIEALRKLKPDYKKILDKLIANYCFLLVLYDIRNLFGYNYLRPHLTMKFQEKASHLDGAEIDQILTNAINDEAVSTLFNTSIEKRINEIISNLMEDNDLTEYFGKKDRESKIKTVLSYGQLPRLQ